VTGAEVVVGATMLDMEMGTQSYALTETAPGVYSHAAPALVMVGHWGLSFEVTPKNGSPFSVLLVDRANG
jgi:copper transport protein